MLNATIWIRTISTVAKKRERIKKKHTKIGEKGMPSSYIGLDEKPADELSVWRPSRDSWGKAYGVCRRMPSKGGRLDENVFHFSLSSLFLPRSQVYQLMTRVRTSTGVVQWCPGNPWQIASAFLVDYPTHHEHAKKPQPQDLQIFSLTVTNTLINFL